MAFLNFDQPDEKQPESWDSIQKNFAESDIGFSESPTMTKTAGANEQVVRSVTHSLWAGSATINEQYELEAHVKEMVDEGRMYPAMEKALKAYGYAPTVIRRVFHKVTGIDPVMAYLDTSNYVIPPDAVPRYNYGWGPSKEKEADYFFVLPFTDKFAIYKQRGLNREIVFQHVSMQAAQDELKKYVKDVKAVTPDLLTEETDTIQFRNRIASVNVPTFDNPEAAKLAAEVHRLKLAGDDQYAKKMIVNAVQEGLIDKSEQVQLLALADADDPSEMTSEDKERKEQIEKYRRDEESGSLEDEINRLKLPSSDFQEVLEDDYQFDMKQLTSDAFDLLKDISQSVPGFEIKPVGSRVDLMDVQSHSADPTNHIDTGSIRFVISITDTKSGEELKGLVIMFIINGSLQYSGKFKGGDNREYALSTPGLNDYFDSAEGKPVEDLHYTPKDIPQAESLSPYK